MEEALIPLVLMRHHYPLRGVMIDRQPWVCAREFAVLIGHRHPERICRLMEADQVRTVPMQASSGRVEDVEVISESGLYRVLCRFTHPENRHLRRWLSHVALPALRDSEGRETQAPARRLMAWEKQQVTLLDWQGELWIPLSEMPSFQPMARMDADSLGSRLGRWWRGRSPGLGGDCGFGACDRFRVPALVPSAICTTRAASRLDTHGGKRFAVFHPTG